VIKDILRINNIIERFLEDVVTLVTDENGFILYIHSDYAKIVKIDPQEAVGKYCCDIIPGSRMHIVAKSGMKELGVAFKMKNGEYAVVNRLPITNDGKVVGVICFVIFSTMIWTTAQAVGLINSLKDELSNYKNDLTKLRGAKYSIDQIIGDAPAMKQIKESVYHISQTKSAVLISGETGTGKELFAHAIHQLSPRSHHPLIMINCAAIPAELFETELFGYEEGAFTGARKGGKVGKFELANKGTLVLDEIHQMPLTLQPKLLRVLQEQEVERVGSNKPIDVDVRLISITNKNIFEMVSTGQFREDLFYRINTVPIEIPPLRERLDDLPLIVKHLIKRINKNLGLNISGIGPEVIQLFRLHDWPGNVRELEHILERAANIVLSGSLTLDCFENLASRLRANMRPDSNGNLLASAKKNAEHQKILEALAQTQGNVSRACEILSVSRSVLYEKIKRYNIKIDRARSATKKKIQ
jgi:transcriptional regulator with PAS, ATPase and Fis domain